MQNYQTNRVVKEIPVFLSKEKDSPFYVFEYPTRPSHCNLDHSIILEARFKRENKAAEIDLSLQPTSANYDSQKGRELFQNNSEVNFESGLMDKVTFRSQPRNSQTSHYAVGVLKDGALFLTGLAGWLQLLPTFRHFDKGKPVEEDAAACEKARAVTVKFAAGTAPQATGSEFNSRRSWLQYCQSRDREPWTRCRWIGAHQCRSEAAQQHLFGSHEEHSEHDVIREEAVSSDAVSYLTKLVPVVTEVEERNLSGTPSNTVSLSQLRTMPLCDQIRAIFVNAKVLRFQRLLEVLRHVGANSCVAGGLDLSCVLRYCGETAVLVRGIWVVRSEALFPPGTFSTYNGVPAELLCRGRDYILWKFTQGRHITRKEISSVIKLPSAEVTEILQQISRQRQIGGPGSRQRWEFLHEHDNDFIRKHTDVWQRSEAFWAARVQQLCSELRIDKLRAQSQANRSDRRHSTGSGGRRSRSVSRSTSMSECSDGEVYSDLLAIATSKRSSSGGGARQRTDSIRRSRSGSESSESHFAVTTKSDQPLSATSAAVSTSSLLSSSAADPANANADRSVDFSFPSAEVEADMRTFVLEKLRSRLVVSQSDLARFYQVNAARLGVRLEPPHLHQLFQFTVTNVGGIKLDNEWPTHGLPKEPLFAWAAVGDGHDPLRGVLLAQFRSSPGLSFQGFRRAAELAGITVDDNILRRLLKNYCIFHSKSYHLKGTLPSHGAMHS